MPKIEDIPNEMRKETTESQNGKKPAQYLSKIAGKQIGRVPANLFCFFGIMLQRGLIKDDGQDGGVDMECEYSFPVS